METAFTCPICGNTTFAVEFEYTEPPPGEIHFDFVKEGKYDRKVLKCKNCHHYISTYKIDPLSLYTGDYVNSNYQDMDGLHRTFERIISLDAAKSDNKNRVRRILEFGGPYFAGRERGNLVPSLLDIGSGLGVFPYEIKKAGWDCTALDPDPHAIEHIREYVGTKTLLGDLMSLGGLGKYDVITFNKVFEHVEDPVEMLRKAKEILHEKGFVYCEVPDGEMASQEGKEREEFFIDHIHVFSFTSLSLLIQKAGFAPVVIERLREPSTKFTLRVFCINNNTE